MACTYPTLLTISDQQVHTLNLRIADTFFTRLAGLLLTPALHDGEGLLITRCNNVHTIGMRMTIDVIYLDQNGRVIKCVPDLKPCRASYCKGAAATLELAQGSIARLNIAPGSRLDIAAAPSIFTPASNQRAASTKPAVNASNITKRWQKQAGAAMMEFIVVGPIITLIGLATLEYSMLFFAKNNFNHAAFMAARAGSTGNADLDGVRNAYARALIPQFGGGTNPAELQSSLDKARADVATNATITMLNPTKESFDDFNDKELQNTIGKGKRVISNANMGLKAQTVGPNSGQSIGDANLIKLRITHGYEPKTPIIGNLMLFMLKWYDDGQDSTKTALYDKPRPSGGKGYVPVIIDVTLKMQSDPIEPDNPVSLPGPGNNGNPTPPGPAAPPKSPPNCATVSCTAIDPTPTDPGGTCTGNNCSICLGSVPVTTILSGDVTFAFGQSTLTSAGAQNLDQLIEAAKKGNFKSVEVSGYTDQFGSAADNLTLSQARAQSVKDYLVNHGLPAIPITAKGLGATNFIVQSSQCSGTDAQVKTCLAPNRRVEVKLNP